MPRSIIAFLIPAVLLILTAADPFDGDPALRRAEERYASANAKAEALRLKTKLEEAEKRLRVYRTALEPATRAGDFDKAQALKARIESLQGRSLG